MSGAQVSAAEREEYLQEVRATLEPQLRDGNGIRAAELRAAAISRGFDSARLRFRATGPNVV